MRDTTMNLRPILVAALLGMPHSVLAAPTASCLGLISAYDEIQKQDESLPSLFVDPRGSEPLKHSDRIMITGIRDNVGSFQCNEKDDLDQLELDYNGAFLENEQQKQFALLRFTKVAVALIRAFKGDASAKDSGASAKASYDSVMLPAAVHTHNAILRGDEDPTGETVAQISAGYELKMKINREGPTLYLQRPGFDR